LEYCYARNSLYPPYIKAATEIELERRAAERTSDFSTSGIREFKETTSPLRTLTKFTNSQIYKLNFQQRLNLLCFLSGVDCEVFEHQRKRKPEIRFRIVGEIAILRTSVSLRLSYDKIIVSNMSVDAVGRVPSRLHFLFYLAQQQYPLKRGRMRGEPAVHRHPRGFRFPFHR